MINGAYWTLSLLSELSVTEGAFCSGLLGIT